MPVASAIPPSVFPQAIATVPLAVLVTDDQGVIRYVNEAFERLTLYPADEAIGQTPRLLKSGRQNPDFYAQLWATIRAGRVWTAEVMNRRRDGTLYRARHIIVPIPGPDGAPTHFIGFQEDVTALRAAEERLRLSERLEVVGRLTSGIAHDLNNILTVILGNTELLSQALAAERELRTLAEAALKAAESAAELTTRMLAFARRQPLAAKPTDIDALLAGMRSMLGRTLGGGIAIELVDNGPTWPALVDPLQLESALLNLCVNARDAMPEGGRLTIETANVRLGAEDTAADPDAPAADHVMIAVSDTGTGMQPEVLARACDPFFTTKELGHGNGLGLSMVYGFVEQSQGRLQIRSAPGEGTTVTLYLPRAPAGPDAPAPGAADLPGGRETVLLVEDDARLRAAAAGQMRGLGYRVIEAATGTEALAALDRHAVDLLFADLGLRGGMDGRALAEAARAERPGLKVLFTSGDPAAAPGDGASLLAKPYRRRQLAAALRAALGDAPAG
jgi:PAS domain S-box-containing protein